MGSVTESAQLVTLEFCSGNGGMSELSSWLTFVFVGEVAVSGLTGLKGVTQADSILAILVAM